MALEVGARVGDYEVVGVIGTGGMGRVYKVRSIISNREEAMKVLLPDLNSEQELAARFIVEIRTLAGLEHPNIAQLRTAFQFQNQLIMIMEFVEGATLEKLASESSLPVDRLLDYATQTLSALSFAHTHGVIHRDIKPANIMITTHGQVKLMDFGIAKNADEMHLTRPGMTIGSVYYMSPEQVRGGTVDGRSDLYSLGVTLYELLTGRKPFQADTSFSVLNAHLNEAPLPPIEVNAALSPELNSIILRALAKSPADRYELAKDMAMDLEAINHVLKREHVTGVLNIIRSLMEQEQWASARPALLELQQLSPQNTEVKKLLRAVQEKLPREQESGQICQLVAGAEEAILAQKYAEAIELFSQAAAIDQANRELARKLENARQLKERADKVAALLQQSREARQRSDFGAASELIDQALQLDERNTNLRNERTSIVQGAEKANRQRSRRQISDTARSRITRTLPPGQESANAPAARPGPQVKALAICFIVFVTITITGVGIAVKYAAEPKPAPPHEVKLSSPTGEDGPRPPERETVPVIDEFSVSRSTHRSGESVVLEWRVHDATGVSINGVGSDLPTQGNRTIYPDTTKIYRLKATGPGGTVDRPLTVNVTKPSLPLLPVIESFSASNLAVKSGQTTLLQWNVRGATEISIGGVGQVLPDQTSRPVCPTVSRAYELTASGAGGTVHRSVNISVTIPPGENVRLNQFGADPTTITRGQTSVLRWQVENASSVWIDPEIGQVEACGVLRVQPQTTTKYQLSYQNDRGTMRSKPVIITVE